MAAPGELNTIPHHQSINFLDMEKDAKIQPSCNGTRLFKICRDFIYGGFNV